MGKSSTSKVTVTIKYLVNFSEKAGRREEDVGFPMGSTLVDVIRYLKETRNIILPRSDILALLNGRGWDQYPHKWNTPVINGDIILLFPPISGG
jgi:molybdopterin converting factor small subunit